MIPTFGLTRLMLVLVTAAPMLGACGSDVGPPPAPAPSSAGSSLAGAPASSAKNQVVSASCTEQQVRECRVELGQQGTVKNCFVGLQLCKKGVWGPCLSNAEIEGQLDAG